MDSIFFASGFETPEVPNVGNRFIFGSQITGSPWNFVTGGGLARNGSPYLHGMPQQIHTGDQVLFLQNHSEVEKSLTLPAGYYQMEVKAAQRVNVQTSFQTVEFLVNGNLELILQPASNGVYESFQKVIYLPGGQHALKFRGLSSGVGVDNTMFLDEFKFTRLKDIVIADFEESFPPGVHGFQYNPAIPNWSFANGGGFCQEGHAFAVNSFRASGDQVLFLQNFGHGALNLEVPANGMYRFRFEAALRDGNPTQPCLKQIRVTIDGSEVGKFSIPSTDYTEFVTLPVFLTQGFHTLKLQGFNPSTGDHSAVVDDLRIEPILDWQDPYSWQEGQVPGPSDMAMVVARSVMGMRGNMQSGSVMVEGNLLAAQNQDFTLFTDRLMVEKMGASLEVGSELAPYLQSGTFNLTALPNEAGHMHMGNNFIGAMHHATIHLHGKERVSWTQLGINAAEGATQIVLAEPVDWKAGDEIVIVSSTTDWDGEEEREIASVSSDSLIVTLTMPLDTFHCGKVMSYSDGSQNWIADLRAEVGLLTHNIKIQAIDTAATNHGYGGHTMVMHGAKAYCSGVELYHMGQKKLKGRYPWHWHMLADGGQGQYFKNSSVHHSFNRAVTIHGTDHTLVENNFLYDHIGHGVFLEDGGERFNTIRKNVALKTRKPKVGDEVTLSDNQFDFGEVQNRTPATYWITNPQNTFEDNVAAGTIGTGYWFALPKTPLHASKNHPHYAGLEPYKLPLESFKGNSAHSCRSGFDVFDHVDEGDSVVKNGVWLNHDQHVMENCTWYANDMALYAASAPHGPSNNLVWKNNVLVENNVAAMIAAMSRIENSVIVAHSGENLADGPLYAYRVYDGPGQVRNSHFVGWNQPGTSFFLNTGAAIKHVNHRFSNITFDPPNVPVNAGIPNYDLPLKGDIAHNAPENPRMWIFVLRDSLGDFGGDSSSSIVSNHPFLLNGNEAQIPGWGNLYYTPNHYMLGRITHQNAAVLPDATLSRENNGVVEEQLYLLDGFKEWTKAPLIVNQDYLYTYDYDALPSNKKLLFAMNDADSGDEILVRFRDFGKLGGLVVSLGKDTLNPAASLAALKSQTPSGYFMEPGGDLYLKGVVVPGKTTFTLTWSTDFALEKPDSDGDGMADGDEMRSGRHPFDAVDLAALFNEDGNAEGWGLENNLANPMVVGGWYQGLGLGDAMTRNHSYDFAADRVPRLYVRIKADTTTMTEFFYATDTHPGYNGGRSVRRFYTTPGNWQTLEFDFAGEDPLLWQGKVTSLRMDPTSGDNVTFEIDWIRAQCLDTVPGCPGYAGKRFLEESIEEGPSVKVYPNPFSQEIHLHWENAGAYDKVSLIDLQGKLLISERLPLSQNTSVLGLDKVEVSGGMYILRLSGRAGVETLKLLKE